MPQTRRVFIRTTGIGLLTFYVASCKLELTPGEARQQEIPFQAHDIPDLVIAGAGLFPTSARVNPTFTIHALAARSSEHLLNHWNSIVN